MGAMGGWMFSGTFHTAGHLINKLGQNRVDPVNTERQLLSIIEASKESKTRERDPEAFEEFVDKSSANTLTPSIYVDPETIADKLDKDFPKWQRAVPDIADQVKEAEKTGKSIEIPVSSLVTYLQDEAPDIIPDARATPDNMTPNEARKTAEAIPNAIAEDVRTFTKDIAGLGSDPVKHGKYMIFNDVKAKLDQAKYGTDQDRTLLSTLITQRYMGASKQITGNEGNAWGEYQKRPFILQFVEEGADGEQMARDAVQSFVNQNTPQPEENTLQTDEADTRPTPPPPEATNPVMMNMESSNREQTPQDATPQISSDANDLQQETPDLAPPTIKNDIRQIELFPEEALLDNKKSKVVPEQTDGGYFIQPNSRGGYDIYKKGPSQSVKIDSTVTKGKRALKEANQIIELIKSKKYNQSNRGSIWMNEHIAIIQLFKGADPSTLIHELGHLWLDEFFADATQYADNPDAISLLADYEVTKAWMKDIAEDIFARHQKINGRKSNKRERLIERSHLDEIKKRGGITYIQKMIDEGFPVKDEADQYIKMMFHEAWARGFETYVMEGKPPVPSLRSVFTKFSNYLRDIYKQLTGLGVPVDDRIRGVFDRMLGAENTIRQMEQDYSLSPLFPTLESSGLTESQYAEYASTIKNKVIKMRDRLVAKRMNPIKEKVKADGKARIETLKNIMMKEIEGSRIFITAKALDSNPDFAIDMDQLKSMLPEDLFSFIPKKFMKKDGATPEIIAELLGYESVSDFFNDIALFGQIKKDVTKSNNLTFDEVKKKYSEKLAQREFEAEFDRVDIDVQAEEEFLRSEYEDVLVAELNALQKMVKDVGRSPESLGAIQYEASQIFNKMSIKKASRAKNQYKKSMKTSAIKAKEAFLAGDFDLAYKHKRQQILSAVLYADLARYEKTFNKTRRIIKRIQSKSFVKNISTDHIMLLDLILNTAGIRTAISRKKSREKYEFTRSGQYFVDKDGNPTTELWLAIEDFVQKGDGDRADIYFSEIFKTSFGSGMTTAQFLEFATSISSIYTHGQNEKLITVLGKQIEKEQFLNDLEASIYASKNATKGKEGSRSKQNKQYPSREHLPWKLKYKSKFIDMIHSFFSSQTAPEFLIDELDGYKSDGMLGQLLQQLQKAKEDHFNFVGGVTTIMDQLSEAWGKKEFDKWLDSLNTVVPNRHLRDYRGKNPELLKLTKANLIAIAFHLGSPENMDKLIKGREKTSAGTVGTGWNEMLVRQMLDTHLTKQDWEFITSTAKSVSGNWQKMKEVTTKLHGVPPPEVKTQKVVTRFGTFEGWYWPISYEDDTQFFNEQDAENALSGNTLSTQLTATAWKARQNTGKAKPMSIDLWRSLRKINRDSYATHYALPLLEWGKVLGDPRIADAIIDVKGEVFYRHLTDWVKDMANNNRRTVGEADFIHIVGGHLKMSATVGLFGYAIKPLVEGSFDLLAVPLLPNVDPKIWMKSVFKCLINMKQEFAWADQFVEHRLRHGGTDKRMAEYKTLMENQIGKTGRIASLIREQAFFFMTFIDGLKNTMIARSVYDTALMKNPNMTEEELIVLVNKSIRKASPARDTTDKPLSTRDIRNEHLKIFSGYSNSIYNRLYESSMKASKAITDPKLSLGGKIKEAGMSGGMPLLLLALISGFGYMWASTMFVEDEGEEENGILDMIVSSIMGGALSTLLVVRDLYDVATNDMPFAGASLDVRFAEIKNAVKSSRKLFNEKDMTEDDWVNFAEAMFSATGMPFKRPVAYGRYTEGRLSGEIVYEEGEGSIPEILMDVQRGKKIER